MNMNTTRNHVAFFIYKRSCRTETELLLGKTSLPAKLSHKPLIQLTHILRVSSDLVLDLI